MRITKPSKRQIDKLSDIMSDIGLVAFASVALPSVIDKFDRDKILLGLLASLLVWLGSLRLRR